MKETLQLRDQRVALALKTFRGKANSEYSHSLRHQASVYAKALGEFGACRNCIFLKINVGKNGGSLECIKRRSIFDLHDETPLGQKAECDIFQSIPEESEEENSQTPSN
jgi:hypothetical protein